MNDKPLYDDGGLIITKTAILKDGVKYSVSSVRRWYTRSTETEWRWFDPFRKRDWGWKESFWKAGVPQYSIWIDPGFLSSDIWLDRNLPAEPPPVLDDPHWKQWPKEEDVLRRYKYWEQAYKKGEDIKKALNFALSSG